MTHHILKSTPAAFDAVTKGDKTFELRINDRYFQRGDTVEFIKYNPKTKLYIKANGNSTPDRQEGHWSETYKIMWVLPGGNYGLSPEYVAFSFVEE